MQHGSHRIRERRPWGHFEQFTENENTTVKLIRVEPHARFSLQRHFKRKEYWYIIAGSGVLHLGDITREVNPGDEIDVPKETLHRMEGGDDGVLFLEITYGDFDEDDIERLADDFGRV